MAKPLTSPLTRAIMDPMNTLELEVADRYVTCDEGHEHWGAAGAAGLLVQALDDEGNTVYLLQHRSPEVHMGDCWGVPGGALDFHESALEGAVREVTEEMLYFPTCADLKVMKTVVVDHGGWAYTTLVVQAPYFQPEGSGWETGEAGFGWFTADAMNSLKLHEGFAAALPELLP